MAKNWKYAKEKAKFELEEYLSTELGKTITVLVKMPEIVKKLDGGHYRSTFQATTIEVDGKELEKILIIKNYENVEFLRKKISGKKKLRMEITRQYNEDEMETYFDIKMLKV